MPIVHEPVTLFILLLFWHFLADYPLQGDFLARAKDLTSPIAGIPWWQAMFAHCAIHAGGVYLLTGSVVLLFCELVVHAITDMVKCALTSTTSCPRVRAHYFNQDQFIHVLSKAVWVVLQDVVS